MLPSQFILSVIVVFIIIKTIINYRIKQNGKLFYLLWIFFWLAILYFIYNTQLLSHIANLLGIGRGVDFAVYISIILTFYLIYLLLLKINQLQNQLTLIVRQLALFKKYQDNEKS